MQKIEIILGSLQTHHRLMPGSACHLVVSSVPHSLSLPWYPVSLLPELFRSVECTGLLLIVIHLYKHLGCIFLTVTSVTSPPYALTCRGLEVVILLCFISNGIWVSVVSMVVLG